MFDVRFDRPMDVEETQIERNAAAQEVGGSAIGERPPRMEARRLAVSEGLEENLCRPPSEERALLAEHLPLHETNVRATEDDHQRFGDPRVAVPQLLQDRR